MNLDENINVVAQKKASAKQSRRAAKPTIPDNEAISVTSDMSGNFEPPARVRKTGRWAEEGSKTARVSSSNLIEQERFHENVRKDDSDDDIPVIPDIDDVQEDVLILHDAVMKKPTVSVNKSTYKELNTEFANLQNKIASHANFNLTYLTTGLLDENDVKEVDELWALADFIENFMN